MLSLPSAKADKDSGRQRLVSWSVTQGEISERERLGKGTCLGGRERPRQAVTSCKPAVEGKHDGDQPVIGKRRHARDDGAGPERDSNAAYAPMSSSPGWTSEQPVSQAEEHDPRR